MCIFNFAISLTILNIIVYFDEFYCHFNYLYTISVYAHRGVYCLIILNDIGILISTITANQSLWHGL